MIIATLESVRVLDETDQLSRMIIQSELAMTYRQSLAALKCDKEAQALIQKFVAMKERYEEVQRFGKYHPDYKMIKKQIREIKREVDLHDTIVAFKMAENHLQKLLDEISMIIGKEISPSIKVPTGNPFFDSAGGCGGCGTGCSCQKTG
ncbi:YlbF family regulator [Ectobacillus polymachus]|uniref:YlbF family regulator n=1 Tax=Ectobacillus polymachus TaxID=1508806 RepID=UPI003A8A955B